MPIIRACDHSRLIQSEVSARRDRIDPQRDRDEERWKALVLVLRGDGHTKRPPYMA
jgi:hypothetical protein